MKEMLQVFQNEFGISFFWRRDNETILNKIQLVFKETGMYLTMAQMREFRQLIDVSRTQNACCEDCALKNSCHKFLLKTPCDEIDLAVSMLELYQIDDLVRGTLFTLEIEEFVHGVGRN